MTTISNKVRLYRYSDANAPVLSGTAGALISLLDACLVDGYDNKTINTLTVTGTTATAVISAGHSYEVGAVIRIAGATPAALNGDWRLASVTGTDAVFSVEGLGIAEGAATGTITALRAPAGWAKIYSGTNRAAYRSLNHADHNGQVLYIDDTSGKTARARGYESMSDIDTGVGPWPTDALKSGGCWWGKSDAASAAARNWALVADSRRFGFAPCVHSSYPNSGTSYMFGRLLQAQDIYAHCINSALDASWAEWYADTSDNGAHICPNTVDGGIWLPRALSGASGAVVGGVRPLASAATSGGSSYPTGTLANHLWTTRGVVGSGSSSLLQHRGLAGGYAHVYANITEVTAGFEMIGSPGNGALVMVAGTSARFLMDLGSNGSWD